MARPRPHSRRAKRVEAFLVQLILLFLNQRRRTMQNFVLGFIIIILNQLDGILSIIS